MDELQKNDVERSDDVTEVEQEQGSMPAFLERATLKAGEAEVAASDLGAAPDGSSVAVDDNEAGNDDASMGAAVGSFFAEGVASVREMNAARRAHAEARGELERLEESICGLEEELAHRRDIAERYETILEEERAKKEAASAARTAAEEQREELVAQVAELKAELENVKEADATVERRLKSALDAAEDKEKSARESGRRLQRRLDDANRNLEGAKKEREEGIAAAQQAITSAKGLIDTLNDELAALRRTPSANPAEYSVRTGELEAEIARATDAFYAAQEDLPRVQHETQHAIEAAQAAVAEAEKPIGAARASFDAVAAEADNARDAYGTAKDEAESRQKALRRQISDVEKAAKEQARKASEAQDDFDAAQAAIDEAEDIHSHPEATEAVARALETDRVEHEERAKETEELAAIEQDVRSRTRGASMRLMVFIAGVVLVVVLMVVWLFVAR